MSEYGHKWYVSSQGVSATKGTKESPWDLESALLGKQPLQAGDTLYLLGGIYRRRPQDLFEVKLAGAENLPIQIRPEPNQHVTIDGGLTVQEPSSHLWIWDLEILVSEPNPTEPVSPGSHPEDLKRPWGGLHMHGGTHCKYINLVIHHCCQGISFWSGARDSEIHGCLIYDNGWLGTDRGHGHAIYTQNRDGIKTISDCIMTGGYGYTMHAYGSERAYVDNYLVEGNICYDGGSFLIGGGRPSHSIRVFNNHLYNINLRLGYNAAYNEDCEVRNNVIVNGGLMIKEFRKIVNEGNLVLGKGEPRPENPLIVLRPNKYDPNRANLAIFNWDKRSSVMVDAGDFLKKGDRYRLLNPRDFFGQSILEGRYSGEPIEVSIQGEFGAFVLLKAREHSFVG